MADEQSHQDNGGGVATAQETLTVTDNRTGETYEVPITDGTVRRWSSVASRSTRTTSGLMTYDPAFTNTASCRSEITYIDGEAGILQHRGYSIEDLCEHSTYLEVAYLLIPVSSRRATSSRRGSTRSPCTPTSTRTSRSSSRASATTRTRWGCCCRASARCHVLPGRQEDPGSEERHMAAVRLIAKMPTLAGFAYRHNLGLPYVYPDNDLSYPANFLAMLFKMTELKYEPDPRLTKALDVLSSSTPTTSRTARRRRCARSARRRSIRTRGRGRRRRLVRPAARRANEAVLKMLDRIETVDNIPPSSTASRRAGEADGLRAPGLQETTTRAPGSSEARRRGARVQGKSPKLEIATELEKRALDDEYFTKRKLYPNVDYYSG